MKRRRPWPQEVRLHSSESELKRNRGRMFSRRTRQLQMDQNQICNQESKDLIHT